MVFHGKWYNEVTVGDTFGARLTVTETHLVLGSGLFGDFNPLHADPEWSLQHWDDDPTETHDALLQLSQPFFGDARVVASQVKRWRFATPTSIWPEAHWSPEAYSSLAVAGDAFAGPRIEGAALSGLSAAAALLA